MTSSRAPDPAELCRRLRETPAMQALLATVPDFPTMPAVSAPIYAGVALAVLLALAMAKATSGRDGLRWDFQPDRDVLTVLAVAIGVSLLVAVLGVVRSRHLRRAPASTFPAVVVSKRSMTWRRTTFYMTFWIEGRGEEEQPVDVTTFGDALPGDVGGAWFRKGRFVGFRKLAVRPGASD